MNDDGHVNRQPWTPRDVEDLLHGHPDSDPQLAQLVQQLRAGRRLPPAAGALAQVLSGELAISDLPGEFTSYPAPVASRPRTGLGRARALVVAAVAGAVLLTGAAAANALPEAAQRAAATVLNAVTPFSFPMPMHHQKPNAPTEPGNGTATLEPTTTSRPTDEPTDNPTDERTGRPATQQPASGSTLRTGHDDAGDVPGDGRGDSRGDSTQDGTGDSQPTSRASSPATSDSGETPEPDGQDTPAAVPTSGPSDSANDRTRPGTPDNSTEGLGTGPAGGGGNSVSLDG